MNTSGLLLFVSVILIGYLGHVTAQVSFSTHWGGGKRSSILKTPPESRKRPSIFYTEKGSPIFDTPSEIPQMFRDNNDLLQCLTRMEANVMKYLSLILENELKQAQKCILAAKDVEYD